MYHLARIAHQETVNKMGPSNLAVIFAPCILRRTETVHAQEQLQDVQKQAICVQMLIEEKLRQYKDTLNQIVELEQASEKVSENLRRIEEHRRSSANSADLRYIQEKAELATEKMVECEKIIANGGSQPNIETAKQLFSEQLEFLDNERWDHRKNNKKQLSFQIQDHSGTPNTCSNCIVILHRNYLLKRLNMPVAGSNSLRCCCKLEEMGR